MITVEAFVDTAADIYNYRLLRATSPTGPFRTVSTIASSGSPFIYFNDYVTTDRIYYYEVASLDSCGYSTLSSQISNSIFLDVKANENYTNTLTWNNYELWDGGVSRYVILRNIDNVGAWTPVTTIPYGGDTMYLDVVSNNNSTNGRFCYKIMAIEGSGNQYGFTDTAYSNDACVQQQPAVFIPSAFNPEGTNNKIFIPYFSFLSRDDYYLKIYNRFGGLIFETSNPSTGWDGTYFGHSSPEGVYIYYFTAKSGTGDEITKVGSFTLVR
jgi:gliding motility-associated-like protein